MAPERYAAHGDPTRDAKRARLMAFAATDGTSESFEQLLHADTPLTRSDDASVQTLGLRGISARAAGAAALDKNADLRVTKCAAMCTVGMAHICRQ